MRANSMAQDTKLKAQAARCKRSCARVRGAWGVCVHGEDAKHCVPLCAPLCVPVCVYGEKTIHTHTNSLFVIHTYMHTCIHTCTYMHAYIHT